MTQDQHDPTAQAPGSTESASTSGAEGGATTKTATTRAPRHRRPSNRSRQPRETQETQAPKATREAKAAKTAPETKETNDTQEQRSEPAPTASESPVASVAAVESEAAPATATATATATETPKRATTRGRRGGSNRRRNGKTDVPDIQLVPVTSPTEAEPEAAPTEPENPMGMSLPAPEPLPLDTAILAHLDALSQAAERRAAEEKIAASDAEEQPAAATESASPPAQRRYRFDRPRGVASAEATPVRPERLSGWRATPPTLLTPAPGAPETTVVDEDAPAIAHAEPIAVSETPESTEPTEPTASITVVAPEITEAAGATEAPEPPEVIEAPAAEEHALATDGAEEADLSEHESASRRRRRRRGRSGHGQDTETGETEGDEQHGPAPAPASRLPAPYAAPETTVSYARDRSVSNGYQPGGEDYEGMDYSPYTTTPRTRTSRPSAPAARRQESSWSMSTAQQHVQESESPFGAPEPSFAHGFGPQSSGVASPLQESLPRIRRGERSGDVPMSANQLGTIITGAIAQQTDRLLSELRRQQYPPSMTVALPAFPSTERIGVFVDVANLLYSARSQRMSIDFGRLLDFLRGNRRLIRAHAYAPTNPDPHAEQTFLSAVKGVGYRITTKNYKTFASGARKADMDLDLCMDIVRLVDADALDTVMLVSGDSDFLPLLEYCSDHGVRVEVAAFDDAAAMILRQSCDLFINLSQVDEIRA